VLVGKNEIEKKEVWRQLGNCDQITKRQAQRLRDEVMRDINREVYTIQSQMLFGDFAPVYEAAHRNARSRRSTARCGVDAKSPAPVLWIDEAM